MRGVRVIVGGVLAATVVALTNLAAGSGSAPPEPWVVAVASPLATVPTGPSGSASTTPDGRSVALDDTAAAPLRASPDWVSRVSAATGIGPVAVRAYGTATLRLARDRPGCRIGWSTLAAIGAVESGHGTHDGAVLLEDGHPSMPVIGPALDGTSGTAAIRAGADDAAWHGDTAWAHAVGPMQFLPSTWRRWASDGDGDGALDPNDLDDAAVAAGRYLCASGADLTTGDGWRAAIHSYNHDDAYVALVLATANAYARRV